MLENSFKASTAAVVFLLFAACLVKNASGSRFLEQVEAEVRQRAAFLDAYPDCEPLLIPAKSGGPGAGRDYLKSVRSKLLKGDGQGGFPFWGLYCLGFVWQYLEPATSNPFWRSLEEKTVNKPAKAWIVARLALSRGNMPMFQKYLNLTHKGLLESGYLEAPELALPLMALARRAMKNKEFRKADRLLEGAVRFDFDNPWIFSLRLESLLRRGAFLTPKLWGEASHDNLLRLLFNAMVVIRVIFSFFFAILLLIYLAKYFRQSAHPIAEALPRSVSLNKRYLTVALILTSLPVMGFGWVTCGLVALLLVWPNLLRWERKLMWGFLIYLCVLPLMVLVEYHLSQVVDSRGIPAQYNNAVKRGWDPENYEILSGLSPLNKTEAVLRKAGLSIMLKKKGDYEGAYRLALEALKEDPRSCYALNNLGNLNYIYGQYEYARENYRIAFRQSDEVPELLLNLSLAEAFLKNSGQADVYLKKALSFNNPNITAFMKYNNTYFIEEGNQQPDWPDLRKVMDLPITSGLVWRQMTEAALSPSLKFFRWRSGPLGIPALLLPLAVLAWWVLAVLLRRLPLFVNWETFSCRLCGRPVCGRCCGDNYCEKCEKDLNGLPDNDALRRVKRKVRSSAKKRLERAEVLGNLIYPGAGAMATTPALKSFLTFLLTTLLWGMALSAGSLVKIYPDFVLAPLKWVITTLLVIFYLYFLVIGLLTFQKRFSQKGKQP